MDEHGGNEANTRNMAILSAIIGENCHLIHFAEYEGDSNKRREGPTKLTEVVYGLSS